MLRIKDIKIKKDFSKEELIKHRGDINTIKDEYPLV